MRDLSPFITGLFEDAAITGERSFNSQVAVVLTLNNGSDLNIATGSLTMDSISYHGESIDLDDPIIFEARAGSLPAFRHTQGTSPDAGQMALINLDYIFSQLIPEPTRLFENAKAKVYICFPKENGNYEGVLYFRGFVRMVSGDDDEAPLSLISDMSDKKATVGEEMTQRCLNSLGDWAVGGRCGATHLPPGAVCTKDYYDKEAGCIFWGQMHAFWGIPFINPTGLVSGYSGIGGGFGGGGWDEPPVRSGCVDPASWVKRASGIWDRGYNLKVGEETIDARGRVGVISLIEEKYVEFRYLIEVANGAKLRCSADHPITTALDDEDGRQAYTLRPYVDFLNAEIPKPDQIMTDVNNKFSLESQFRLWPLSAGTVLNISMDKDKGSKHYIAGVEPGFGIEGHNFKPIEPIMGVT